MPEPILQQCRKCRVWEERDIAFRRNPLACRAAMAAQPYRAICIGCEQTARDARKAVDPFIAKARSTIRKHAERRGMKAREFIHSFGWDVPRVAHMMRHAFENTCVYCRRPYSGMRNGPSDVTMDILNPLELPYLETNALACCSTCNSAKRNLSPEAWARKLRFWRRWEDHHREVPPLQQLVLGFMSPEAAD